MCCEVPWVGDIHSAGLIISQCLFVSAASFDGYVGKWGCQVKPPFCPCPSLPLPLSISNRIIIQNVPNRTLDFFLFIYLFIYLFIFLCFLDIQLILYFEEVPLAQCGFKTFISPPYANLFFFFFNLIQLNFYLFFRLKKIANLILDKL